VKKEYEFEVQGSNDENEGRITRMDREEAIKLILSSGMADDRAEAGEMLDDLDEIDIDPAGVGRRGYGGVLARI
jgi:hypothetical protein